jgi:hypothetical protein
MNRYAAAHADCAILLTYRAESLPADYCKPTGQWIRAWHAQAYRRQLRLCVETLAKVEHT